MKLSTKYILFITLIHLTALVLSFFIFEENKLLFLLAEVVLLLSLYFSYRLYRSLVSPIELISTGTDAIRDKDFNVKFQKVGQFELDQLIEVYNNMIDQLRTERTHKVQKHFFLEKLINTSPTGIIILDLDGKISTCNPKAAELLQQAEEQVRGKTFNQIATPFTKQLAALKNDETQTIEINGMEVFKCHKAHFIDRGFANYFILIEELTAEKLKIEKQAYGKVIRMMAHEVNNSVGPINSILESLSFYQKQLTQEDQEEFSEALRVAIDRNWKLNQFMRNFANVVRLPIPEPERIDIRQSIKDVAAIMQHQIEKKQVDLKLMLPNQVVLVSVDIKQFEQVLINVIKNAYEAIDKRGEIIIELTDSPKQLIIRDNGMGISQDQKQQLFSPFFSTKPTGQGIGLTLCREILLNHKFKFSLSSNAGWTSFEIIF